MPETEARLTNTCFVKRAPVSGIHFLFSMVIFFFYRGNFELVSIENGRVNFKEQNEQFLFFMNRFLISFYCRNFGALITSIHFVSASFLDPGFICKG